MQPSELEDTVISIALMASLIKVTRYEQMFINTTTPDYLDVTILRSKNETTMEHENNKFLKNLMCQYQWRGIGDFRGQRNQIV